MRSGHHGLGSAAPVSRIQANFDAPAVETLLKGNLLIRMAQTVFTGATLTQASWLWMSTYVAVKKLLPQLIGRKSAPQIYALTQIVSIVFRLTSGFSRTMPRGIRYPHRYGPNPQEVPQ